VTPCIYIYIYICLKCSLISIKSVSIEQSLQTPFILFSAPSVDAAWIKHRNRSGLRIPPFSGSSYSSQWLQMELILLRWKQIFYVIFEFELYMAVHIWRVNWYFWSNRSGLFAEVQDIISNLIFLVTSEKLYFTYSSESLQLVKLSRFPHLMPWRLMKWWK